MKSWSHRKINHDTSDSRYGWLQISVAHRSSFHAWKTSSAHLRSSQTPWWQERCCQQTEEIQGYWKALKTWPSNRNIYGRIRCRFQHICDFIFLWVIMSRKSTLVKTNCKFVRLPFCALIIISGVEVMVYPLNVSRDCSLLLLLGGSGRMLSVTGAAVMAGEPSSFSKKKTSAMLHWRKWLLSTPSYKQWDSV